MRNQHKAIGTRTQGGSAGNSARLAIVRALAPAVVLLCLLAPQGAVALRGFGGGQARGYGQAPPPPRANPAPPQRMPNGEPYGRGAQRGAVHLPEWLSQHRNMPPMQQEQLLRAEPGFRRLNPVDQQRLVQQLHHMNSLPEAQRNRRLARAEALERLSPAERMQINQAARRMMSLPPERQMQLRRAFRDLRGVPPEQRGTVLNSARYSAAFSPDERGILSNLLRVEPYEPPMAPVQ